MSRGNAPESPPPRFRLISICVAVAAVMSLLYYWHYRRSNRQRHKIDRIEDQRGPGPSGVRSGGAPDKSTAGRRNRPPSRIELQRNRLRMAALQELLKQRRGNNASGTDPSGTDALMRARFQQAQARDALRYSAQKLAEIDSLYERGIAGRDSEVGAAALQQLIESFPESNRAGCSSMNLAATYLNDGKYDEAATYLEKLINGESTAVFGNGERVLPKALFNYGLLQQDQGNYDKARAAWQRLVDEFPNEKDSSGTPYGLLAGQALKK